VGVSLRFPSEKRFRNEDRLGIMSGSGCCMGESGFSTSTGAGSGCGEGIGVYVRGERMKCSGSGEARSGDGSRSATI
jgi:hypothetical protein